MNDHGARAHSIYGASGAHRWMKCPGSVARCQGVPERSSPEAEEGTRAHELLELVLEHGAVDEEPLASAWRAAPEDMQRHVADTADDVWKLAGPISDKTNFLLEHAFELPSAAAPRQVFGTADVVIVRERKLIVVDFKYGAGVPVDVEDNPQLLFYGLGAYLALKPDVDTVELVIIQPRCPHPDGPMRKWTVTPFDLLEFAGEIEAAIVAAQQPDAPLVPGMKQCRWCNAAPGCPAREGMLLDVGLANAREAFAGVQGITPATMAAAPQLPPERIAHILRAEPLILNYFDEVRAYAMELMSANPNAVPGYKIVEAREQRRYTHDEDTTADMLWALCDGDVDREAFFERKLKALTNAEKIVVDHYKSQVKRGMKTEAAKQANEAMAYLTTKSSSGKLTIAPLSDDRPAVNRAQQSFGGVVLPGATAQVTE